MKRGLPTKPLPPGYRLEKLASGRWAAYFGEECLIVRSQRGNAKTHLMRHAADRRVRGWKEE